MAEVSPVLPPHAFFLQHSLPPPTSLLHIFHSPINPPYWWSASHPLSPHLTFMDPLHKVTLLNSHDMPKPPQRIMLYQFHHSLVTTFFSHPYHIFCMLLHYLTSSHFVNVHALLQELTCTAHIVACCDSFHAHAFRGVS